MANDPLLAAPKVYEPELIEIRRDIHRQPEVGFEETRTAALVAEHLRRSGLDVTEGVAGTDVAATFRGRIHGKRAIQETGGREHGSVVSDKMHACDSR
jgi:hippurate hydrolase